MKFIPTKQISDYSDLNLQSPHDLMSECIKDFNANIARKRENQIIEALIVRGHTFQNKEQLYEFAKQCEIRMFEEKPDYKELWYENELICTWDEKVKFIHEGNKITAIVG